MHELEPLSPEPGAELAYASKVSARTVETGDEAGLDRIVSRREDDRDCGGGSFGGTRRDGATRCDQNSYPPADEVGRECWQAVNLTLCIVILNRNIASFEIF
jgi:hypothetical protein